MSKVILPEYVAEYLDFAKSDTTLMRVMELANTRNEWEKWNKEYDWIEVNHEQFARAWLDGYEVEPEFKLNEWIYNIRNGKIFQMRKDDIEPVNKPYNKKHLRHATPEEVEEEKERRWWKKHGRDSWELKTFDILHDGQHPYVITGIDHEYSRIELDGSGNLDLDGIEKRFKVACFVENRLDVKDDE